MLYEVLFPVDTFSTPPVISLIPKTEREPNKLRKHIIFSLFPRKAIFIKVLVCTYAEFKQ